MFPTQTILDIFCLKHEALEDSVNLLAAEIVQDLEAAVGRLF